MSSAKAALPFPAVLLSLFAAPAAFAQTLGQAKDVDVPWWRLLLALLLCLGLAVAGAYALRLRQTRLGLARSIPTTGSKLDANAGRNLGLLAKRLFQAPAGRIKLIQSVRVSPQLDVCLLSCDGKEYLIAATPQSAVVLSQSDVKADAEASS